MPKKPSKKTKAKKQSFSNRTFFILAGCILVLTAVWSFSKIQSFQAYPKPQKPASSLSEVFSTPSAEVKESGTAETKQETYIPQTSGYQLRVPIFMYHYVGNNPNPADKARDSLSVSPDKFEEQMKYLSDNGYVTISLDTLYAALQRQITLPNKPVVLTFDDGYIDFFVNAYPILRRYNLRATVFIPTGLMSQGYYLSWDQIKEMSASGIISFGAHTVRHYNLPSYPREIILSELRESKRVLQDTLGVPVNFMAYPNGAVNSEIMELTRQAGYFGATGTWANLTQSEGTIYNMPRLRISGSITIEDFTRLL